MKLVSDQRQVIIGTAGHIDHGKTALVKALTGVDADTLAEEKRRGITIELGFVFMNTPDLERQIVFIDVPGHERLIKTMVAGASNLDAAMLVIAADEGVSPQTREHFEILQLLGLKRGLIALTKSDLVEEAMLAMVTNDIREYLTGSFLENAPIVPVSAVTGAGVEDIRQALITLSAMVEPREDTGIFRMPVDRVFTMQGFGTVIAGTVLSGQVKVGDRIEVYPESLPTRVRGIQIHSRKAEASGIGLRTAINVQDLKKEALRRGQCAAAPGSLSPTNRLDAQLYLLNSPESEVKHRMRLRLHIGTDEIITRVALLDRDRLAPGETATVQFVLEAPTVALPRDPFVVRTFSPLRTIGGGVILDAAPNKHKRFDSEAIAGLSRLEGEAHEVVSQYFLKAGAASQQPADVAQATGRSEEQITQIVEQLLAEGELQPIVYGANRSAGYLHQRTYQALREQFVGLLTSFYEKNPRRLFMPLSDLQSQFSRLAERPVYETVLRDLERSGVVERHEQRIGLVGRELSLPPAERKLVEQVAEIYRASGLASPLEDEVRQQCNVAAPVFAGIMGVLLEQGRLVRLSDKVTYHRDHLMAARETIRRHIEQKGNITVAELRNVLGVSRKYALALLEYLDEQGFTRREGDARVLA